MNPPARGFRPADDSGVLVPSRAQVLDYLTQHPGPRSLPQLYQHFGLTDLPAQAALRARLGRMQGRGILSHSANGYAPAAELELIRGRVCGHPKGFGFVVCDGEAEDLLLRHHQMRKLLHGDRVLARLKHIDRQGRRIGEIIEVCLDPTREIVGRFGRESGVTFVQPDDNRYHRDFRILPEHRNGARDGDIVVLRVRAHPITYAEPSGEIVKIIGRDDGTGIETEIAIHKHQIPTEFPDQVAAQLKTMQPQLTQVPPEPQRRDLRDLPLVTIDGADARDFDDAVYCEPLPNQPLRGKKSHWRLVVAIADVSYYVRPDTALDDEARNRGNSVYFPTRVVPMLPEVLSNGICSLNPGADRYCMVCDMRFQDDGEMLGCEFYPGLMRSHARLTYAAVDKIITQNDSATRAEWRKIAPQLDHLREFTEILLARRAARGGIDFEFPEAQIEFATTQKIAGITARSRNRAHRLIEECMLAANRAAADFLQQHLGGGAIYRNHFGADPQSLAELRAALGGLGVQLSGGDTPTALDYARLVESVAARPDIALVVQTLLLRSLSQAEYSTEQAGHFALSEPIYTHFTSPIRRYCDLVVHRQIRALIRADRSTAKIAPARLVRIAAHCNTTERRAEDASREVIATLKAQFMADKLGQEFNGSISAVKEFGVFVQLDDLFIDGLVHVTALGDDYYQFEAERLLLRGQSGGRVFRLGQAVRVVVTRVNVQDAKIDFELVMPTPTGAKSAKPKSSKTKPKSTPRKSN